MSEPAPGPVTLLSDGVVGLRRPAPADVPAYWKMRNDLALVTSVMGFRLGVSEQTAEAWIRSGGGVSGDDLLFTAVLEPDGHRPIGYIKAYRVDRFSRHAWLGLCLFEAADRGRGYGRRMIAQTCDYLRDYLGLRKVSLEVLASNAPAIALYGRLGFVEEGRLRSQFLADGRFEDVLLFSRFLQGADPA
ncbi:MAG: GNAT family N-acetyltransferase [Vicinamibacterales bacterium]